MKQNKLKKYFCVILAVLMLIPLAACKNSSPPDDNVPPGDKIKYDGIYVDYFYYEYNYESGFTYSINRDFGTFDQLGGLLCARSALSSDQTNYNLNEDVALTLHFGLTCKDFTPVEKLEKNPEKYRAVVGAMSFENKEKNFTPIKEISVRDLLDSKATIDVEDKENSYKCRQFFNHSEPIIIPNSLVKENLKEISGRFYLYIGYFLIEDASENNPMLPAEIENMIYDAHTAFIYYIDKFDNDLIHLVSLSSTGEELIIQ